MLKKIVSLALIASSFCLLTGCASIIGGTSQTVSVQTVPVQKATCSLENNKGQWFVPNTPGSVTVHRSYADMNVVCRRPGYAGKRQVQSNTKALVFGNVILGGPIGAGVDIADGAAYDYPTNILVTMHKSHH